MADRDAELEPITEEAKRIEEDALHSSQSQFEAARQWNGWHLGIGISATIAGAVAAASVLGQCPIVAGLFAILAAILSGVATFVKPSERAVSCLNAGNAYNALRNDVRIFRTVQCTSDTSIEDLRSALHAFNSRRNTLNNEAPSPPRRAYLRGRTRIEEGETTHQVDSSGV